MRIWYFDKNTGELSPSMEADKGQDALPSPCEKGVFLESIYSTRIAPPEYGEKETVIYADGSWTVKKDYRSINAWYKKNGSKVFITDIGVEPDGEFVETAPEGIARPVWDDSAKEWREKTELEIYDEEYAKAPEATVANYASMRRSERDRQIRAEQDMIDRHANEIAEGDSLTETADIIAKRRKRIKALRDVPAQATFPRTVTWPEAVSEK